MNDTTVSAIIVIILICHVATISIGYKIKKTVISIAYLNTIFVIGMLLLWIIDLPNIKLHQFQFGELFVLCLEACILVCALYTIIGFHNKTYVKVINYFGFWLHLLAATAMLIFMFTFKLDRLF